jgi:hypothetical protein
VITFQEMTTHSSMRDWTLTGPAAVVKVVSVNDAAKPVAVKSATGYVTQAKFIKGMNAIQIEAALGLRPNSMKKGGYVFFFARLPLLADVEQRFTADMPDGQIWSDKEMEAYMQARADRDASGSDLVQSYPPGSARVMQWQLTKPVPLSGLWKQVTPSLPFEI